MGTKQFSRVYRLVLKNIGIKLSNIDWSMVVPIIALHANSMQLYDWIFHAILLPFAKSIILIAIEYLMSLFPIKD